MKDGSGKFEMIALGADQQQSEPGGDDGDSGDQKKPELFAHAFELSVLRKSFDRRAGTHQVTVAVRIVDAAN